MSAVETVGDTSATTKAGAGRDATDDEISGATYADGLGTAVAGVFGGLPNTSFSERGHCWPDWSYEQTCRHNRWCHYGCLWPVAKNRCHHCFYANAGFRRRRYCDVRNGCRRRHECDV